MARFHRLLTHTSPAQHHSLHVQKRDHNLVSIAHYVKPGTQLHRWDTSLLPDGVTQSTPNTDAQVNAPQSERTPDREADT